ncbi:hypothetical protein D910_03215 [Dendroctonus ponderosae]|uniref:Major facilitator superfamily (MFS) profile domain-containing protein n=1 Tax=Dendroctonus ponderosae TaxID=77166 RepID=U4U769_DENPD|nr:hypothetical protein D910_03215 [Dendroctonus ponderosae]
MLVLIWLGFLTKQQTTLAVILLNIQAISAVKLFGSLINHVDLSPRYTGVLMGLENTLGQVIAMFAPIFNQLMVADLTDVARWRSIFLSLAAVEFVTCPFFILLGSAEVPWWNSRTRKNEERQ